MPDAPAAVSASLVDIRNVSTHKVVRLELHVPAEQAPLVMQAFGWPTMVAPIPVAVARLNGEAKPDPEPKEKRRWDDLTLREQAVIRCKDPAFWKFCQEKNRCFPEMKRATIEDQVTASEWVRWYCGVISRSDLNTNRVAAEKWRHLDREYQAWLRVA